MNIAFAFTWLFNPHTGGTERVTDILAKGLKDKGHNVYYIYTVKRPTDEHFENPADETLFIPEKTFLNDSNNKMLKDFIISRNIDVVINQGGVMGTCRGFVNLDGFCHSVAVIHFQPTYGLDSFLEDQLRLRDSSFIEKLKRIYRLFAYPFRYKKLRNYLHGLYRYWSIHTDRVILLSDKYVDEFLEICPECSDKKLSIINNPLSFPNHYIKNKENIILWVGRMDLHQKRPDLMVRIWRKIYESIPNWELIMLGDGPDLENTMRLAAGLPRVHFLGNRPSQPYFQRAAICASTSSTEGFPMVLLEAISQGAVPIAFESYAAIHDIIKTSDQLVNPFDLDEYTRKLKEIVLNEDLQNKLRQSGSQIAENFTLSNIIVQWETLLTEICG